MFCKSYGALACFLVVAAIELTCESSLAADRIRAYHFGEDDPGAMLGGMVLDTQDYQQEPVPGSDIAGGSDFVPLVSEPLEEPTYVEGRGGPGSLAVEFDGLFGRLTSPPFDPRNFANSFTTLSQAWIKPDSEKEGQQQYI
jgi:hypothetical protein